MDTVVLEVGLGGRLDATNVVHSRALRDHPHRLRSSDFSRRYAGSDRRRKGGDLEARCARPSSPSKRPKRRPCCAPRPRVRTHSRATAPFPIWSIDARGSRFSLRGLDVTCPLAGEHQVENARTAAIALARLGVPPDGIASARWPGRLERVSETPEIILDGAHNPGGVAAWSLTFAASTRDAASGSSTARCATRRSPK